MISTTTTTRKKTTNDPPGTPPRCLGSNGNILGNASYALRSGKAKSKRHGAGAGGWGQIDLLAAFARLSNLSFPALVMLSVIVGIAFISVGRLIFADDYYNDYSYFPSSSSSSSSSMAATAGVVSVYDGPPLDFVVHGSRNSYEACPMEYRKKAWLGTNDDSHIPRAYRSQGWETFDNDKKVFDGTYHQLYIRHTKEYGGKDKIFAEMKPWQRFSKVPGMNLMEHKDTFLEGFRDLQQRYEQKQRQIGNTQIKNNIYMIPETYNLGMEKDRISFQNVLQQDKAMGRHRPWVFKNVDLNNGKGVEMIPPNDSYAMESALSRSSNKKSKDKFIMQAYICNELTWFGGEKFDLRFYWMVASVDPLIVLYHDGYARVAAAQYDETNFDSSAQHLTNHKFRGEVDEDVLATALWRRIRQYYDANKSRLSKLLPPSVNGDPVKHVKNQLKESISATAAAWRHNTGMAIEKYYDEYSYVKQENSFSMYGADFIIDADLDVFYVEAQTVFGLGDSYDYRVELFRGLLRPMINIVEEIADKQAANPKGNILPIESLDDYEIVYAGTADGTSGENDWRYEYHDYKRSINKKGCDLASSKIDHNVSKNKVRTRRR